MRLFIKIAGFRSATIVSGARVAWLSVVWQICEVSIDKINRQLIDSSDLPAVSASSEIGWWYGSVRERAKKLGSSLHHDKLDHNLSFFVYLRTFVSLSRHSIEFYFIHLFKG